MKITQQAQVTAAEWRQAEAAFAALPSQADEGQLLDLPIPSTTPVVYRRFVRLHGVLLGCRTEAEHYVDLAKNELGHGQYGQVVLAEAADGKLYALKSSYVYEEEQVKESAILQDLGLGLATVKVSANEYTPQDTYITAMQYLGIELGPYLAEHAVSDEQALTMAISLSVSLAELHLGLNGKSTAHLDIKPGNVVVDEQGQLHIIDFGCALQTAKGVHTLRLNQTVIGGTRQYLPAWHKKEDITNTLAELDTIALIRTVYMPESYEAFIGPRQFQRDAEASWILSDELVAAKGLLPYLSGSHSEIRLPLSLACTLLLAKHNLPLEGINVINVLLDKLSQIQDKANQLERDGHTKAAASARALHQDLSGAVCSLIKTLNTPESSLEKAFQTFQIQCDTAVQKSKPTLSQHRGWLTFLGQVALAIVTVCTVFLVQKGYRYAVGDNHASFFGATRSLQLANSCSAAAKQWQDVTDKQRDLPTVRPVCG